MSEEIIAHGWDKNPIKVGRFEWYPTNATTLNQFKKRGIIPDKEYGQYGTRKPDGLLVDRTNKKRPRVILAKEDKPFRTPTKQREAVQQCNDICQVLDASMGLITNSSTYIWINPQHANSENEYQDRTTGATRSYSIIRDADKKDIVEPFQLPLTTPATQDDGTKDILDLIDRIIAAIDTANSDLSPSPEVDPLSLAQSVWQDIYVSTGKSPQKCLYNVVELFIFKFQTDLNLLPRNCDFNEIFRISRETNGALNSLKTYARSSRKEMIALFPRGRDGTTILNGTIFVDSNGDPVASQANLFKKSLKKYDEFGSLKNVKKEFKTKLFEAFLRQSSSKSRLGQFFTPRKVVRAMVDMAEVDKLQPGARICDPFCGVGGFIAESIQKSPLRKSFRPVDGKITPSVTFHGFDKGFDDEEERVIILAKANLMIYLSDLVEQNPGLTEEFARLFNDIFYLIRDTNLGTLSLRLDDESKRYDVILTNPPYITRGVNALRHEIATSAVSDYYKAEGKGVDSLCLEWIIRSLKRGGRAFVIVPYGLLSCQYNSKVKKLLRECCHLNTVISLPSRTFFNTPQKTYIIGFTRKTEDDVQSSPVFTYLVSNIGEGLDTDRFEIPGKSDLQRLKELYLLFKGAPESFPAKEIADPRLKIMPITHFGEDADWCVDRVWSDEEKVALGIIEQPQSVTLDEFADEIARVEQRFARLRKGISEITSGNGTAFKYAERSFEDLFERKAGRWLPRSQMVANPGPHPVYSAVTKSDLPVGSIGTFDYDLECLQCTTNGANAGHVFYRPRSKFSLTPDAWALVKKDERLDYQFLLYETRRAFREEGFDWEKKVNLGRVGGLRFLIPVDDEGNYDINAQQILTARYRTAEDAKAQLFRELDSVRKLEVGVAE